MEYLILPKTAAEKKMLRTEISPTRPGCFSVIGVLQSDEEITFEIPANIDPDVDTDAHWTPLMQSGAAVVLSSTHNAESVPVGLVLRVSKPATDNAVGLRWF